MRSLFVLLATLIFGTFISAQTNYSPLYTSSNFVKTIDLSRPVGTVNGAAGTTPTGGVTYSIPIYAPPGSNGIQPSLSLAYNSQGSAGVAGFGWSISGFSVISRSGKDLYHNSDVAPVNYTTTNDAFLLDGVRLNPVSGDNGLEGTIYATESESFSSIVSHKTSPGLLLGPDWFEVTTKEGAKMEFGNTTDSRFLTDDGEKPMLWRLNRITDVNGNYIDFKYDNTSRDSRIDEVNYTGNINTGMLPYNKVKFIYGGRYETNTGYETGASASSLYLLNKIIITHTNDNNGVETVKTYSLKYGFDNVHSLLKEIEECGALPPPLIADRTEDIGDPPPCLNSTIFLYGDPPPNIATEAQSGLAGQHSFYAGDFDADGKSDLLLVESYFNTQMNMRLDTKIQLVKDFSGGSFTVMYEKNLPQGTISTTLSDKNFYNFFASDYDKDGRDDVLELSVGYSTVHLKRYLNHVIINKTRSHNSSTGYYDYVETQYPAPPGDYKYIHESGNFFIPGDFDGDGVQDYLLLLARVYLDQGSYKFEYKGFASYPGKNIINVEVPNISLNMPNPYFPPSPAAPIVAAELITPLDVNGDGKQELLVTPSYNYSSHLLPVGANSYPYEYPGSSEVVQGCKVFPGDFNGDRRSDMLVRNANGTWKIVYSTGVSFFSQPFSFNQPPVLTGNGYCVDRIVISDFNGDGKTDILHGISNNCNTAGLLSVYYSKGLGSGFQYEQYSMPWALSSSSNATNPFTPGDFNGDGRTDLLNVVDNSGAGGLVFLKPNGKERLLRKVTDGHNVTSSFDYELLSDKTNYPYVYNRTVSLDDPANQSPYNYVQLPLYVVSSVTSPDGIGGTAVTSFSYEDAVVHRYAKGFLGFKKITSVNDITRAKSITENEINTQFATPYTVKQTTILAGQYPIPDEIIGETFITNSFINLSTGSHDIRFFQKTDNVLSVDHLSGTATESVNTYDSYGNVTVNVAKVGTLSGSTVNAVETSSTTTVYGIHNTPVPAKPDNVTASKTRAGMPAITTATAFSYTTNGLPSAQTTFSGLPNAVTTSFTYNGYGNMLQSTTSAAGVNNRVTIATYDAKGRYPLTKEIIGGSVIQKETFVYDGKWGKPLSHKSIECITTTSEYDAFGKIMKVNMPEGYAVNTSFNWDVQGEQLFYTFTDFPAGKPDSKTWIDKMGREIKTQTMGFNGQWLTQLTTYNQRGEALTKTNSYYAAETPVVTTSYADDYGRPYMVTNPLSTINYTYTKLTGGKMQVTTQNSAGQSNSKISDAAGKVISAIDNGGQLDFTYDSRGSQVETKHGTTVLLTNVYDVYGRQTSLTDKNAGTVTYQYDAYGQLTQQTDNIGNSYTMSYDDFGRVVSKSGTEGTTSYEYYAGAGIVKCKGHQLKKITGFNGVIKEYMYDALSRLQSEKVTIDGIDYLTSYTYDGYSNPASTIYPSGVVVNNVYDANGNLISVSGGDSWNPVTLFTANAENGYGQLTSYTLGNGKTSSNSYQYGMPTRLYTTGVQDLNLGFDFTKGNLLSRYDALKNLNETFQYDNLDRLTTSTVNGVQQLSINYDGNPSFSMGNITSKTDAGNYVYKNDKIHAVAYITNPAGPTAPPVSISPNLQNITYTPFLKTASVVEGSVQTTFTYGPDYERVKSQLYVSGNPSTAKIYPGTIERVTDGSYTRDIHYIPVGNSLAIIEKQLYGNSTIHFVYTDYLGSLLVRTDINGNVTAEQNFDAWGRNRNPYDWQYAGAAITNLFFDRGYTGHEHMRYHEMINMNGRMYDPVQGRMLSPDNYVPDAWHTQGYNRYSYANNNPLKYTDPDGNFIHLIVGAIIGGLVNLATNAMAGRINNFWDGLKAFGIGAIQGAAGAAIAYGGFGGMAAHRAFFGGYFKFANIIGNLGAGIGSSFIPSVPIGNNFSISPSFALGSHGISSGLSARFRSGNFSLGIGFNTSGSNSSFSYGAGWDDGKLGLSYTHTKFSGSLRQATGSYGFRVGRVSGSWENDLFASGNEDRWRTNGMSLSYGFKNGSSVSIGSRLMTGEDDGTDGIKYPTEYNENPSTLHREGIFYVGYSNAQGISTSAGVDSERWRYGFHKFIHSITRDGVFKNLRSSYPTRGFIRYGNNNPYTHFW